MKKYLMAVVGLLLLSNANAGLIKVSTTNDGGNATLAETMRKELENELNTGFPSVDGTDTYLNGMANAGIMAGKGQGTDYTNDIDLFVFAINAGVGIAAGDDGLSFNQDSVQGMGLNASLLFGLNLGVFDLPEMGWFNPNDLDVFFNILPPGAVEQNFNGATVSLGHIGVHARYPLIKPVDAAGYGLAKWGGVHLHTGIEISSFEFAIEKQFNSGISTSGGTAPVSGPAKIGAEVSSISVPVEVSTYGQLAYFLTGYAGLGVDLNVSSNAKAIDDVNLSTTVASTYSYSITTDLDGEASGDFLGARYFVGLQLGAPVWKPITLQVGGDLINNTYDVKVGTKFVW